MIILSLGIAIDAKTATDHTTTKDQGVRYTTTQEEIELAKKEVALKW